MCKMYFSIPSMKENVFFRRLIPDWNRTLGMGKRFHTQRQVRQYWRVHRWTKIHMSFL